MSLEAYLFVRSKRQKLSQTRQIKCVDLSKEKEDEGITELELPIAEQKRREELLAEQEQERQERERRNRIEQDKEVSSVFDLESHIRL